MPIDKSKNDYSEQEAQQRFMTALKAAVNTPSKPLKSMTRKDANVQRKKERPPKPSKDYGSDISRQPPKSSTQTLQAITTQPRIVGS
jgi:hypothetical protein